MNKMVESWIEAFVERQKVVVLAIDALRADLLAVACSSDTTALIKAFKLSKENHQVPNPGVWRDQNGESWEYFLHGLGCRLIHAQTREPIEWDAPDERVFDAERFIRWAKWRTRDMPSYSWVTDTVLMESLQELVHEGTVSVIKTKSGSKYQLVPRKGEP